MATASTLFSGMTEQQDKYSGLGMRRATLGGVCRKEIRKENLMTIQKKSLKTGSKKAKATAGRGAKAKNVVRGGKTVSLKIFKLPAVQ
jgi:hypothetical protein